MKWQSALIVAGLTVLLPAGCVRFQTHQIEERHWALNESLQQTNQEQLLLNIVRMRYDETPLFLQVSAISTSFSSSGSAGATGTLAEGGSNALGFNGSVSYSESPTVTWSLPDSLEYYGRLMAPIGTDQLTVLGHSGWGAARVLHLGVKKMNRLRNAEFHISQGIYLPANYPEFLEMLKLIDELDREGLIDFAYGAKSSLIGPRFPLSQLDTGSFSDGLAQGMQYMSREDPDLVEPLKVSTSLFLRFSKESDNDARALRVRELLNLDGTHYSFGIVDTGASGIEQLRSESGKLSQIFDPEVKLAEIVLNNRSVIELLYFASQYVEVPVEDLEAGIVKDVLNRPQSDWLEVHCSGSKPEDAWVEVNYRGHWFYIANNDLNSRSTFTLVDAVFASVVGNVPGAQPLLTLPIK